MKRAFYSAHINKFFNDSQFEILGNLSQSHQFALEDLQKNSWIYQINHLKNCLQEIKNCHIVFEYSIPRMGKRIDVIILFEGIVFAIEYKVGEKSYTTSAINQVLDYSLDLKNFHDQSHNGTIVPILIATDAPTREVKLQKYEDDVYFPICVNSDNLTSTILKISEHSEYYNNLDPIKWINSAYKPTPTIIEAAQSLYSGHDVKEISRSDSGAINLSKTSDTVNEIIEYSKINNKKSICFITGVPGAGKTLAGLNIANSRHDFINEEHAVFLSGNGPLVKVLQEALARNDVSQKEGMNDRISKREALSKTKAFIQNIHHFRDDAIKSSSAPIEKIVIFDEAQRAWTLKQTSNFMARKKGKKGFNKSEPDFLISVLDRHEDWAVIICLVGGGQEINNGEAGIGEWFSTINNKYHDWDVYVSSKLSDIEYTNGKNLYSDFIKDQLIIKDELHLSVSVRSFRSEKLSAFVKSFLDLKIREARLIYKQLENIYPIFVTRNLETAKNWLKKMSRGGEGIGIVASSGGCRLKPYGINVKYNIDPTQWFLNSKNDVRSASFLEDVATEFDIQGLELDWICLAWDANLRKEKDEWNYKRFKGTKWQNINDTTQKRYLLNTYRVLLTRARQGMIIFIPEGNENDVTRLPEFYESVFNYFIEIGIKHI
jgi:hypothetical protein